MSLPRVRSFLFPTVGPLLGGLLLALGGCDLPSEPPHVVLDPEVRTPLLAEQGFVVLGPDDADQTPLIDTTRAGLDSLFAVDPSDRTVFLTQAFAPLNDDALDDRLPPLTVGPDAFALPARSLLPRSARATYDAQVDAYERSRLSPDWRSIEIDDNTAYAVVPHDVFPQPVTDLLDAEGADVEAIQLTGESDDVNAYTFELRNNLDNHSLTDASRTQPPRMVLQHPDGPEIASGRFDRVPGPGQTATAEVNAAEETLPADLEYRLDVSTEEEGFDPIANNPDQVEIATAVAPFRYRATTLTDVPPQSNLPLSRSGIVLSSNQSFEAAILETGTATVTVTNTLPYPLDVNDLCAYTDQDVEKITAGAEIFCLSNLSIPAQGTVQQSITVEASTPITRRVAIDATASSPGVSGPITVHADDGIQVDAAADFTVEALFLRPGGQAFRHSGTIATSAPVFRFPRATDFVEIERGRLLLSPTANEFDLGLDTLAISVPSIRTPPYEPGDSLTVRFAGSTDRPGDFRFRALERRSTRRDLAIDLDGLRLYPQDDRLTYSVHARSEVDDEVRTIGADDKLTVSTEATDLRLHALRAIAEPFVLNVTPDRDDDNRLDLADDNEAQRIRSGLETLGGFDVEGLALQGTSLALTLRTNITTDAVVYLALLGERDGDEAFLAGRGPLAVSASDTMRTRLVRNGSPIPAQHLMRIPIEGASSPDAPATRTVVLDTESATVDAFMELLPERLRLVGSTLLQPDGTRIHLRRPLRLDIELGVDVPLHLTKDATITHTMDADLAALDAMARRGEGASIDSMALQLRYENGVPLGFDMQLDVLDEEDALLTELPDSSQTSWSLPPAPANARGIAVGTVADRILTALNRSDLETLGQGQRIRLRLTLRPNEGTTARLRATDAAQLSLHGYFELRIQAGK